MASARQQQAKECSSRACCHLLRLQTSLRTERSAPRFRQALRSHHSHHAFLILLTHFSMSNLGTRGRWGDKAMLLQLVERMWVKWWGLWEGRERERERECAYCAPLGNGLESALWFPFHPFVDWLSKYLMVLLDEKEITPSRSIVCMHECMYVLLLYSVAEFYFIQVTCFPMRSVAGLCIYWPLFFFFFFFFWSVGSSAFDPPPALTGCWTDTPQKFRATQLKLFGSFVGSLACSWSWHFVTGSKVTRFVAWSNWWVFSVVPTPWYFACSWVGSVSLSVTSTTPSHSHLSWFPNKGIYFFVLRGFFFCFSSLGSFRLASSLVVNIDRSRIAWSVGAQTLSSRLACANVRGSSFLQCNSAAKLLALGFTLCIFSCDERDPVSNLLVVLCSVRFWPVALIVCGIAVVKSVKSSSSNHILDDILLLAHSSRFIIWTWVGESPYLHLMSNWMQMLASGFIIMARHQVCGVILGDQQQQLPWVLLVLQSRIRMT